MQPKTSSWAHLTDFHSYRWSCDFLALLDTADFVLTTEQIQLRLEMSRSDKLDSEFKSIIVWLSLAFETSFINQFQKAISKETNIKIVVA